MSEKINWDKYTPFQQKVYGAIMKIAPGKVLTYGQVARLIGKPKAARAVGNALSKNQDMPLIPCHRVVSYNGIGGYSAKGGIKRKVQMLKRENAKFNNS